MPTQTPETSPNRGSTSEEEIQALIAQVQGARGDVEKALVKLARLSEDLRTKTQRLGESARYRLYTNEHIRFASAAVQGLRRAVGSDRVLDRIKSEGDQARLWEERQKRLGAEREARMRARGESASLLPLSDPDAFAEVYEEVIDE